METDETKRISGKWIVLPLMVGMAVVLIVFLTIQLSGRGSATRNYILLHYSAGLRDVDEGFYASAVKNLTPVVEAGVKPEAFGLRGEAYLRMKKYAEAEADFREAIVHEPNLPANHAGLGAALASQGKHEEAVAHYDAALGLLERRPAPPGDVRRTGDTPEAVRELRADSERRSEP